MLLAIVFAASCALGIAWPALVVRRASVAEVQAAEAGKQASKISNDTVLPEQADATEHKKLFDNLVRRARRSRLWPVPIAVMLVADLSVLGINSDVSWMYQLVSLAMVIELDVVLMVSALSMFLVSRRNVSARQREKFLDAWGERLGERAERIRQREEARRAPRPAKDPIIRSETHKSLTADRELLLKTGRDVDRALAQQVLGIVEKVRELETSPHRDGHADASAQIYAEQALDALDAYLELSCASEHDVGQVRSVLSITDEALDQEAGRLDGKSRLSLDATKRATEALYRQRIGTDPKADES